MIRVVAHQVLDRHSAWIDIMPYAHRRSPHHSGAKFPQSPDEIDFVTVDGVAGGGPECGVEREAGDAAEVEGHIGAVNALRFRQPPLLGAVIDPAKPPTKDGKGFEDHLVRSDWKPRTDR